MPPYWKSFIEKHSLVGREFSIPDDRDASGVGAVLEILDEQSSESEETDVYPGIAVRKDGFVPVGSCCLGSGDPYFICERDGEGGPLYRIYHDQVSEAGYEASRAIAIVLNDYRDLLRFAD
ncbi:hypothetical protein [Anatilimnocola floriformis]|uniref:hypothetical protein n=1 Tax=Anatilimnocola floriformis TaxID=2948575 RepID=UPI0020C3565D|nr:hypothetical protein [Anatilimnocola floriformis]